MSVQRVRVRRRGLPRLMLVPLFLVTLYAFARFALPALPQPSPADDTASSEQTPETRDVDFPDLSCVLITLTSTDGPEAARVEAARYTSRGAAGYVLTEKGRHFIVGALYEDEQAAAAVRARLREGDAPNAELLVYRARGARLRITATTAQIDALQNAELTLRAQTNALATLAFSLDQNTTTIDEARGTLFVAARTVKEAKTALETSGASSAGVLADALCRQLEALQTTLEQMADQNVKSPLFFSSKMKYNCIRVRLDHLKVFAEQMNPS